MTTTASIPAATAQPAHPTGVAFAILMLGGILTACAGVAWRTPFPFEHQAAPIKVTKARMVAINTAIQSYTAEIGTPPATLASLIPEYLPIDLPILDAWKRPFIYERTTPGSGAEHPFTLRSLGRDGFANTDDVDLWTMNTP